MKRLTPAAMLCVLIGGPLLAEEPAARPPELDLIGKWDGKTESAELTGPYEDPLQQEVPFGRHSYFLTPWRAYMDTWPASRFLECLGIGISCNNDELPATSALLEEVGMRSSRVEFGWGGFQYVNPGSQAPDRTEACKKTLRILKDHGMRPLILLNAHHGVPCPMTAYSTTLVEDAPAGARTVTLKDPSRAIIKYSGITGLTDYLAAECIFTKIDYATGVCELSKPLPKAIEKDKEVSIAILRYQPFAGATFADGSTNFAAQETLDGWMMYVRGICELAKDALGTEGKADAGFDLEVWNEYTFGSNFLNINNYYEPDIEFKEPIRYSKFGRTAEGVEIILPMTVDFVNDPANRLPGVNVLSGFSNQRPWENGVDMWPGQAGISRHYYTGANLTPITPQNAAYQQTGPINALGTVDGKPDGKDWHTVVPGSYFIPVHYQSLPERNFHWFQTEGMVRELQPFPGPWPKHFRFGHPGTGRPAQVWQTEYNWARDAFAGETLKGAGVERADPNFRKLIDHVAAKATLRTFVFQSHKNVHTVNLFSVKSDDLSLGFLNEEFFRLLAEDKYELTDRVRQAGGEQARVLRRATDLMRTGERISEARPLGVSKIVEYKPRLVFKGDGTPEHPDRFHRDDLAILPYQLSDRKYAVAFYVVTRNMTLEWDPSKEILDPKRYDMPNQEFDVTLTNIRGEGATVVAYDPMTDEKSPVQVVASTDTSATVKVQVTDYPRFLLIEESQPGPLFINPRTQFNADGSARVTFETNVPVEPILTWGALPERSSDGRQVGAMGTQHAFTIPALKKGAGIQLMIEQGAIKARLPRWGYDAAGVNWGGPTTGPADAFDWYNQAFNVTVGAAAADKQASSGLRTDIRLPAIPLANLPAKFSFSAVEGVDWELAGPDRATVSVGDADDVAQGSFERIAMSDPYGSIQLLPALSAIDECTTDTVVIGDRARAWRAIVRLDPAAHPGETQLAQLHYLIPLGGGDGGPSILHVKFTGTQAAMEKHVGKFDTIVKSITLE